MRKGAGVVLLVVSAFLLYWAYDSSQSVSSEFSRLFRGGPSDRTQWYVIGGVLAAAVGLGLLLYRPRKKSG